MKMINACADEGSGSPESAGFLALNRGTTPAPIARPQAEPARRTEPTLPAPELRQRVLVVEDAGEAADFLALVMNREGFKVTVAPTGDAALELLAASSFDVALMDIELPDMTGFEVASTANASGRLHCTQIIFCSGNLSKDYGERAADFSDSRFLWKPFSLQDLMQCIQPSGARLPSGCGIASHRTNDPS
jgi:two-component system, OmpR family, aerobic respiration control sensor histidine kinase ArcB